MAVTDADQFQEVQGKLLEDASFSSGLWTLQEVYDRFNERQNRFNRDTLMMLAVEDLTVTSGSVQATLPPDWIATQRASWKGSNGVFTPVERSTRFAAMMGIAAGATPTRPMLMDDNCGGTLTAELFPVPTEDGLFRLVYASTLEILNFSGAGDIFDIPDDFVPYVCYGVLADLLSKEGRGRDLARGGYCEMRYQEGVLLAALLLGMLG